MQLEEGNLKRLRLRLLQLSLRDRENPSSVPLHELDALEQALQEHGQHDLVLDLLNLRLLALSAQGDLPGYRSTTNKLLGLIETAGVEKTIGILANIAHTLSSEFRDPKTGLPCAERAYALSLGPQVPLRHRINALRALLVGHIRQGNIKAAEVCFEEVEALFAAHPELAGVESYLYAMRGFFHHYQDRQEQTIEATRNFLEACRITGNAEGLTKALVNLILALKIIGQLDEALIWSEELAEHAQGNVEPNKAAKFLSGLAEVLVYLGRVEEADRVMQPMLEWLENESAGDGILRARNILAVLRGEQGRYLEGYQQMLVNLKLLSDNPAQLAQCQLIAAEMAWHAGLHQEARALLAESAPHKANWVAYLSTWWWLVCYQIEGRARDLEEARLLALAFAATLKNPEYRKSWLGGYYNKQVAKLWEEQDLQRVKVELVCEAGKSKTAVVWTLDSGASDKQHLVEGGKVGLRQHRLRRLVLEATAQGAIPTQPELANVLGVTLRTIESDLAALREKGLELKTLGMKRETVP
jgi:tetratricopeptide (TPR) repeat protein